MIPFFIEFLNDPWWWYIMSPWFLCAAVGMGLLFFVWEAILTPGLARKIRKAKWKKLSMFWVAHSDGYVDLHLGTPRPEGIIKTDDKKHPQPIFVPIPKANLALLKQDKDVKPLTPMDYLIFKRYISRDIGVPMWLMDSAKPAAANFGTLKALEMDTSQDIFQLPQIQVPGNPDPGKTVPFEFKVWIPLDPKVLKASLMQYFSSQHILANEKLSEQIGADEAGHDWKKLLLPIAAIMGGVTIVCVMAMVFASGGIKTGMTVATRLVMRLVMRA